MNFGYARPQRTFNTKPIDIPLCVPILCIYTEKFDEIASIETSIFFTINVYWDLPVVRSKM